MPDLEPKVEAKGMWYCKASFVKEGQNKSQEQSVKDKIQKQSEKERR
jgi:hypothetical protein